MQQLRKRITERFSHSATTGPIILAVIVGLGAGLGAIAFRWLIGWAHDLFFGSAHQWLAPWGDYQVIPVPAIGGLLVGLLIYFLAREAKGHGVPEVMLAVAAQGGRIRPRVAVVKSLASALCIGSGGSAGREGPIVQIGSALGSTLGQILHLPAERVRLLVACGAAGGIAATFNAPIGGALFAVEVILRDFGVRCFGLVVLASVTATALSRAVLGDMPAFLVPLHQRTQWFELPLYALLGLLAAVVAVAFTRILYLTEDLFDRVRLPEYIKPVIGGLMIGAVGARIPNIFGVGYDTIEPALQGHLMWGFCLALVLLKILATSITIGSGGSGGVFAPSLYTGATLGSAFGQLLHLLAPSTVTSPVGYAVVGMGAVFSGAAQAPVTSVLILFEMTADYRIIVPLMAAVVVSALVSERIMRDSIYTLKIRRRGIDLDAARPGDPMSNVTVEEVMTRELDVVPANMPLEELSRQFQRSGHHGFPVVDGDGRLFGVVTLSDFQRALVRGIHDRLVSDIATRDVMVCHPQQTLREALARPAAGEVGRLPVVDPDDPTKLVGVLRRGDIIHAYAAAASGLPAARDADTEGEEPDIS